ncbi:MAG: hypothetical protein GX963_03265 [Bacteroidales bacterium]|nr:hypothetical protein [Bacteroidales bacterium]
MRKKRKSTWVFIALFIYVTFMMFYLIPKNHEASDLEKYITIAVSYAIIFLLWWVLRRKENLRHRREEDLKQSEINKK